MPFSLQTAESSLVNNMLCLRLSPFPSPHPTPPHMRGMASHVMNHHSWVVLDAFSVPLSSPFRRDLFSFTKIIHIVKWPPSHKRKDEGMILEASVILSILGFWSVTKINFQCTFSMRLSFLPRGRLRYRLSCRSHIHSTEIGIESGAPDSQSCFAH